MQAGRHARLEHIHQAAAQRVSASEETLVVAATLVKVAGILATEELLLALENRRCHAAVGAKLAEDA